MSECMKMYQWLCTCLAPHSFASEMFRSLLLIMSSTRLVWKRMVISNFDAWCSIMKNTSLRIWATDTYCVITLLCSIGTVQGSTDMSLTGPNTAQISLFIVIPSSLSNNQLWPCNTEHLSQHKLCSPWAQRGHRAPPQDPRWVVSFCLVDPTDQ